MYVVSSLLKKASLALTSDKMKALELQTKSMYVASLLSQKGAALIYCVKMFYVVTFLLLLATIYLAAIINYVWLLNVKFKNSIADGYVHQIFTA